MDRLTRILIAVGAIILLVLIAVLIVLDKDPTVYVGSITAVIASLTATGLLGKKVGERLDTIGKNVNGKQTALLDENARLRTFIVQLGYTPEHLGAMSREDLLDIVKEANKLPSTTGKPYVHESDGVE